MILTSGPSPDDKKIQPRAGLRKERRSQLRGLLYLAGAILLLALFRANWRLH